MSAKARPRPGGTLDRRVRRTRRALHEAFISLLKEKRYSSIRAADIADRANLGRSTFYEHFRSRDEMMQSSVQWLLAALADAVRQRERSAPLRLAVSHIWSHRAVARSLPGHALLPALRRSLATLVEERLCSGAADAPLERDVARLRAVAIAAAQFGLLEAWVKGEVSATQEKIAAELRAAARA